MNPDLRRLLLSSQLPLVALLVDPLDDDDGATTARGGKKKRVTVMGQFKRELGELMHVLQSSGTHFIRCIKPSPKQEPGHWDAPMVLSQLHLPRLPAGILADAVPQSPHNVCSPAEKRGEKDAAEACR